jgi:hypothetical protein
MPMALAGKKGIHHGQVVGIIDNQQPVSMLLKPVFDCFYGSTLIGCILFGKREEIGKGHHI